ncbi:Esterase/lipase [Devosia lucknowensis]|uniref:Palmitoyl-protein thioesterase ABHD10, mitochondrial n=1 Tax=Devosia lucknowensis TaxID=1096929 RepID=A0A1Y6G6K4_9HYPH|nr:alpha/beta fold hydrolase [Devosia lucknowensis]SMQ85775.1 Esterase/lipase [Devosia lucknowensis]
MSSILASRVTVGQGAEARDIAVEQRTGAAPGLFWLNGFRSVMSGAKAMHLDALGAQKGLEVTRFDYSGHGQSGGAFDAGTISRWLEETEAVFERTHGPQIACGSSMGGWLALLLARRQCRKGMPLKGLVLIAPATDATSRIAARMTAEQKAGLEALGYFERDSAYGDGPYRYTRRLIEDGAQHLLFGSVIETGCPVHILQGGRDPDVPPEHAQKLLTHILHDPVTYTLIPDGDHRLSREEDLARLSAAVLAML